MEYLMKVAFSCDHAGVLLRKAVLEAIQESGHTLVDFGICSLDEKADYPDKAEEACQSLQDGRAERAVLVCGSGVGVCISGNKMKGIYASVCHDTYTARQGVEHDQMNALCLGGRVIGDELAKDIVKSFLNAEHSSQERHLRRVRKIQTIENNAMK
jgi:ribose 5-phosphate isomerase B